MAEMTRAGKASPSFGRRWAVPILLGGAGGLAGVVLLMDALVGPLGDVLGGGLSSLAGIGLGFAVAVAANAMCRPAGLRVPAGGAA